MGRTIRRRHAREIIEVPTDPSTASTLPYYHVGMLVWQGRQVGRVLSTGERSATLELIHYPTEEQREQAVAWDPMLLRWAVPGRRPDQPVPRTAQRAP